MLSVSERSTNMAMGRRTARHRRNMSSSMSRPGVAEVDHDHVRGRVLDPPRDAHERVDEGDTLVPGLTQSRLDHRSAGAVLIDDED